MTDFAGAIGVFKSEEVTNSIYQRITADGFGNVTLNASSANSIYKDGGTIRPQSISILVLLKL